MRYRTVICVLLVVVAGVGCGLFAAEDAPATRFVETPVAQTEQSAPSDHETHPSGADAHGYYSPYEHAPSPLRLKIFDSYAIVRATLISSATEAERYSAEFGGPGEFPWGRWVPSIKEEYKASRGPGFPDDPLPVEGEYRAVHTFQFRVIEYLKGSGASEITVRARTNGTRGTEAQALQIATDSLAERDTSSDTHEAFFDPVTVGSSVAADSSNGQLKPASFTDANGASATIQRIEWESGAVKLTLSPHTGLTGQIVDFIELDGTASLSLKVSDATVDVANDTLSWSVSSQPWEDGDLLMVRIREAR